MKESSVSRHRSRRSRWRVLLIVLLILLVIVTAGITWLAWMIAPQRNPGMDYIHLDTTAKIQTMIKEKRLEITLNQQEFNQLARRELMDHQEDYPAGLRISGADFTWEGDMIHADLRGTYLGIPFGALLDFDAQLQGNRLVLTHQHTTVRHGQWQGALLQPLDISLTKYFPAVVDVRQLEFERDQVIIRFRLDLLKLPRLLLR
ncbi:hypothetical protein [Paenibacillus wulumuqiensis]|uniref:hypothetical protein n=1 Tax=Paenibacillus wulumuqiensis TaxID=1567107 RepID=UPI000619FB44|nr:hypothetical protein [Paenibacillus wulumuqiensis]